MIGILIIAHAEFGESLIDCATHVMGKRPPQLACLSIKSQDDPADILPRAKTAVQQLDLGDGVLILSDMYGATPCNIVAKLINAGKIEGLAGVNLPMLVRALTYRNQSMAQCVEKAISGGREGVVYFTEIGC